MCEGQIAPIKYYQVIEVTITLASTGQIPFPKSSNLLNDDTQKVTILDIEFFPRNVYAFSTKNNTIPGAVTADLPNMSIGLFVDNEEAIKTIPILKLNYTQSDPAAFIPFQQQRTVFDKLNRVAWEKSFIQFTAPSTVGTYVVPFGITYLKVKLKDN